MNKSFRLLSLSLITLVLSACNINKDVSSSDVSSFSSKESSSISESSSSSSTDLTSSSSSNSSSSASSSSSSQIKDIKVGEVYTSTTWDETINKMSQEVVGNMWEKIPVFLSSKYEAVMNLSQDGDAHFLVLNVKCYGVNAASATRLYRDKMIENGYTIAPTNEYGYLMKDYYSDLFLSFRVVEAEVNYFDIQAVVRQTREKDWDATSIDLYADVEVPKFPAKCYQTTYDSSRDQITVYALFTSTNAVSEYGDILEEKGYGLSPTSVMDMPVYVDPTGYVTVQLYQTYGDYDCDALYICINNKWPTIGILSYIGLSHFPKLDSETASYDGYTYLDVGGEGKEEDIALCIYYVNVSNVEFSSYVTLLTNYGFTAGESQTTASGVISIPLSVVLDGYTIPVIVSLQTSTNTMCIAIEQQYK